MADYNGMDDFLQMWLNKVKKISTDLTPKQQAKITKAGADKYMELLRDETRSKHYSSHDDKVYGHAADHIIDMAKDVDGKVTGVSSVGWDNYYHAMNMSRINDGTKKLRGDHFITNLQQSEKAKDAVLRAESAEYQKLIKKEGDD